MTTPHRPFCFVAMPFGKKADSAGRQIDFDALYRDLIEPAVAAAGLEPIRADNEVVGGIIHKPMFERLVLCEYAVVDLSAPNANVFYELGVRHAVRPYATVLLFGSGGRLPFDLNLVRALPYGVDGHGALVDVEGDRKALASALEEARAARTDSPVFQLLDGLPAPQLDHAKTDVFREQVIYSQQMKDRLAQARATGLDAVRAVEQTLTPVADCEAGVVIDLFLSYRAVKGWAEMVALAGRMHRSLAETAMVQEQLAFALNRLGEREQAERVLRDLIARRGPSSETNGLLGRIYKDRWEAARDAGDTRRAEGLLRLAIDAYLQGFEADWRDAYPGVNAVTLMELAEPPDARRSELLPVVAYAVKRRIAGGRPDYWDHATLLELAVLACDHDAAQHRLADALAAVREKWEPETTARNLRLIREARAGRGDEVDWIAEIEAALARD